MSDNGLLIGQVAARAGVSRKAIRLYERVGILPAPSRTLARYRVYGEETLRILAFVTGTRQLGFSLAVIRQIVAVRRAGRPPCPEARELVAHKADELRRTRRELAALEARLRALLGSWSRAPATTAAICPRIEHFGNGALRRTKP